VVAPARSFISPNGSGSHPLWVRLPIPPYPSLYNGAIVCPESTKCQVANVGGNIILNGVTDKELELIWGFKAKHERAFIFNPQTIQATQSPKGTPAYNNVTFSYGDAHGLNLITEIVNTLHKKEE
jgi:hypothetical protein